MWGNPGYIHSSKSTLTIVIRNDAISLFTDKPKKCLLALGFSSGGTESSSVVIITGNKIIITAT